eukprot:2000530-Heterocapsa_arctica.AAC.1
MGEDCKHWSRVKGPFTGSIATCPDTGWNPTSFLKVDPRGNRGQVDGNDLEGLVKELTSTVNLMFWKRSALPCQGPGVKNGVPLVSACKVGSGFGKPSIPKIAEMGRCVAAGGFWCEVR